MHKETKKNQMIQVYEESTDILISSGILIEIMNRQCNTHFRLFVLCFQKIISKAVYPMDEEKFQECTDKLVQMTECIQNLLENIENVDENKLEEFKDCIEFLHERVNNL